MTDTPENLDLFDDDIELDETENENTPDNQPLHEHYRLVADPGQTPLRVDKFLVDRLPNASRTRMQAAAEAGCIHVNGQPVRPNYRVKPGDTVTLLLPRPRREFNLVPEDIPLDIVYEDEALLVVNKPAGLVVHPAHGHYTGTLVNALAYHLQGNPLFATDDPRPGLVHRIDKDTSGLLVIAKTPEAKAHLAAQFFNKTSSREYIAVCWGNLPEDKGTIIGNIGRDLSNRKIMAVYPEGSERGKHAVTHYHVVERLGYINVVRCVLETGRTHQIRAHFKHIRHPLFNDAEYGGNAILNGTTFTRYRQFVLNCFTLCPRQALHAKTLGFTHPTSGEWMQFDSPLPHDMATLLERWRAYIANRS